MPAQKSVKLRKKRLVRVLYADEIEQLRDIARADGAAGAHRDELMTVALDGPQPAMRS